TDIYRFDLESHETKNITENNRGYDTNPSFDQSGGRLAWLSMKTEGYEADKNDIIVQDLRSGLKLNLTAHWDGTVNSFIWNKDGTKIFFTAPHKGTIRLFTVDVPANLKVRSLPIIETLSGEEADINGIVGAAEKGLIVTSTKITRAQEIFYFDLQERILSNLSKANDTLYETIYENKVESRVTQASDGEELFSWIVYP